MRLNIAMALLVTLLVTLPILHAQVAFCQTITECDERSTPVLADDSPNKVYFQNLLLVGDKAPLNAFMRLWYPNRKQAQDVNSHIEGCIGELNAKIQERRSLNDAIIIPECQLDTLYSWGPREKVETLKVTLPDGGEWTGPPNPGRLLDTVPSAVGTFGYGLIPVRIKIKSHKEYLYSDNILSDGKEIESWSFATPEHYDEIVRDYERFLSRKPWVGYIGNPLLFLGSPLDSHLVTKSALKASLIEMIRMILNGEGEIHYAKNTCRNRKREFQTAFPTYIDPFPYRVPADF